MEPNETQAAAPRETDGAVHRDEASTQQTPTHIVGIGASAGGLEALERLFQLGARGIARGSAFAARHAACPRRTEWRTAAGGQRHDAEDPELAWMAKTHNVLRGEFIPWAVRTRANERC